MRRLRYVRTLSDAEVMTKHTKLKRQGHLRPDSTTARLLDALCYNMKILDLMMTYQGQRQLMYYGFDLEEMEREITFRRKQEALRKLREQKLLEYQKVEGKFEIALTQKGAQEVLRLKILNGYVLEDGTDCVVVFDIPEHLRKIRIELGKFLESAGFVRFQRSVFISPFDVAPLLVKLFRTAGLKRSWVRVFYAKEQL